jgi:hypothetical protein
MGNSRKKENERKEGIEKENMSGQHHRKMLMEMRGSVLIEGRCIRAVGRRCITL